jgi:branched-chain amino acid transport system substrate-binding protein
MFRLTVLAVGGAAAAWCSTVNAEIPDGVVRIGVLNDTSGIFQDTNGPGSVEAARMAAEELPQTSAAFAKEA